MSSPSHPLEMRADPRPCVPSSDPLQKLTASGRDSSLPITPISSRDPILLLCVSRPRWSSSFNSARFSSTTTRWFHGVAELLRVCWLHINGKIDAHILSPKTTYKVYLVIKFSGHAPGLKHAETSVKLGSHESNKIVFLLEAVPDGVDGQVPQVRSDGWMEIEMGEFFNDEGEEGDVEMTFKQTKDLGWKSGLIIQGMEIRPVC
eukprot:TRINITY_DN5450_c0_g1_i7.p1 TRINITY_DN5450_c0_g1~~TRINITY_DN5450_c0_g1_i7.p1  ORF type:complete len:204 (-),score=35.53 TRINITY_DN5450_c0_g1_i7:282-893(-)